MAKAWDAAEKMKVSQWSYSRNESSQPLQGTRQCKISDSQPSSRKWICTHFSVLLEEIPLPVLEQLYEVGGRGFFFFFPLDGFYVDAGIDLLWDFGSDDELLFSRKVVGDSVFSSVECVAVGERWLRGLKFSLTSLFTRSFHVFVTTVATHQASSQCFLLGLSSLAIFQITPTYYLLPYLFAGRLIISSGISISDVNWYRQLGSLIYATTYCILCYATEVYLMYLIRLTLDFAFWQSPVESAGHMAYSLISANPSVCVPVYQLCWISISALGCNIFFVFTSKQNNCLY